MTPQKFIEHRSGRMSNDLTALVNLSITNPDAITIFEIEDFLRDLIKSVNALYEQTTKDVLQ